MRPIIYSDNEVTVRGEAPGDIWWCGRQWTVTPHGLEARDGSYSISADRLVESEPGWSWIRQLGEKTEWIDLEDFATAFMVALVLHGHASEVKPEMIRKDFHKASREH